MLKRMWAIVLSLVMLVTLCPTTSVFAASEKATNLIFENFEDGETAPELTDISSTANVMNREIVDGGRNSAKALKVCDSGQYRALGFSSTYDYTTDYVTLSYDMKIDKAPTDMEDSDVHVYISGTHSGGGYELIALKQTTANDVAELWFYDADKKENISKVEVDSWYRIITILSYVRMHTWIYDENDNLVLYKTRLRGASTDKFSVVGFSGEGFGDGEILVDNVSYNCYPLAGNGPSVVSSSIANNSENISKATKSVTIKLDQPLTTRSAKLTSEDGEIITCTMVADRPSDTASLTYIVSWTADLAVGTEYTLDITGSKYKAHSNVTAEEAVDSTGVISFTTEEATLAETVLRDGFEDANEFSSNLYDRDYSKPFSSGSTVHGAYQVTGYNETGSAIEVRYDQSNATGTRATLYSSAPYVFGANNAVVVTYKMKISNAAVAGTEGAYTGGNNVWIGTSVVNSAEVKSAHVLAAIDLDGYTGEHYIGKGSNSSSSSLAGKQGYYYDEDKWYNVTFTVDGTKETFTLTDIDTGAVLWENTKSFSYTSADGYYIGVVSMNTRAKGENGSGAAVTIDDIALWQIDTSKATHALTASATANANAVTLTFNQPTTVTADMLAVSTDSEGNTPVEADIDVNYTDFDTNVVTISGLEYGESYYLDYSGVKSAGGAAIASGDQATSLVQFTMPAPTASVMDKAAFVSGNVTLDYWNMDGKANAAFIAAFYKGTTLVDVALLAEKALSAGKNAVSFVAVDVPANADGMIVYALNSLGNLVPLCVPTAKVSIN